MIPKRSSSCLRKIIPAFRNPPCTENRLNSKDSYDEIARIRETIHRVKGSPEEETIPIIIVGSGCAADAGEFELMTDKLDLVEEREIEENTARLAAKKWGCAYFETSAVSRDHTSLTELIVAVRQEYHSRLRISRPTVAGAGH